MIGYLFINDSELKETQYNIEDVAFWINENGTISQKRMNNAIACVSLTPRNNVKFLMTMLLHADFSNIQVTADYLNSDELSLTVRYYW